MVAQFTILGRQVGSHYLALATLGTTFLGSYLAVRGGGDAKKEPGSKPAPVIKASSSDEESFIKEFLKAAEEGDAGKAKH